MLVQSHLGSLRLKPMYLTHGRIRIWSLVLSWHKIILLKTLLWSKLHIEISSRLKCPIKRTISLIKCFLVLKMTTRDAFSSNFLTWGCFEFKIYSLEAFLYQILINQTREWQCKRLVACLSVLMNDALYNKVINVQSTIITFNLMQYILLTFHFNLCAKLNSANVD